MDPDLPLPLLGGLSPAQFMRRHWQKRPLLVRQALPGVRPPVSRRGLFALAASDEAESRLVVRHGRGRRDWTLRHGPLPRRGLPPLAQPGWTVLVQGLDLHLPAAHALLERFRFVPDARLDDLMLSWASVGGGVGPHLDSYDVFLIQVHGRRRWRVGRAADATLLDGVPLKILRRFRPEFDATLAPGDLLYLPPGWAHDGTAVGGECMTASVGFRAPGAGELARELLGRLAEQGVGHGAAGRRLYADPRQGAARAPAAIPGALQAFAGAAVARALREPGWLARTLGEWLTEPKPQVWFDAGTAFDPTRGVVLDRRTRMLYDMRQVFINGEVCRVGGRDARLLRRLADHRRLDAGEVPAASAALRRTLAGWGAAGWLHSPAGPDG
jgi:50S ribosomal protein L16 3-hydroxylase